jgi:tetratricopeptide (TPR) repeat protein
LADLGRTIEGLSALRAGADLAEVLGLGTTMVRAYNNRSEIEAMHDPRAALETSRAGLVLAGRLGNKVTGLLANSGECALRTGDWPSALSELEGALAEEFEPADRAWLLRAASAFRALRGEPVDDRLAEIRRLVGDTGDPQLRANASIAAAFAAFAMGDLHEARSAWQRAASLAGSILATAVPRAARAALWAGDAAAARDDLAALDSSGVHGPAIEADRRTIRAGLAVLEGRPADALALYREALRAWRDLGLAWDEALCGLDMASLLDPADPEVRAAADAAREILTRLGAKPFLARLDAAMERQPAAAMREPARSRDISTV